MASQVLEEPSIPTPNQDNMPDDPLDNADKITILYDNGVTIEWKNIVKPSDPEISKQLSNKSEKIVLEDAPEEEKKVENKRHEHETYTQQAIKSASNILSSGIQYFTHMYRNNPQLRQDLHLDAVEYVARDATYAMAVVNTSLIALKDTFFTIFEMSATTLTDTAVAGTVGTAGAITTMTVGVTGVGMLADYGYTKYKQLCTDDTFIKKNEYNSKVQTFNDKLIAAGILDNKITQKKDELIKQEQEFVDTKFVIERSFEDARLIVAIGPTGYGKSLFCNRMIGNQNDIDSISEPENINLVPIYKVAEWGDIEAQTTEIQKEIREIRIIKKNDDVKSDECVINNDSKTFKLSVADTQGAFDTNNNDKHFQNQMGEYFRACGGVNMFCIFFKFGDKMTSTYKQLLRDYEIFWGNKFWKHCVIVITNCDMLQDSEKYRNKLENKLSASTMPKIKEFLNEVSGGQCKDIPMFCFGKNNYKYSTQSILETIVDEQSIFITKYKCKNIVSPMDILWNELHAIFEEYKILFTEIKNLKEEIETLKTENNIQ